MRSLIRKETRKVLLGRAMVEEEAAAAAPRQKEKLARGREKKEGDEASDEGDEEETSEQEFQKATKAMCIDGGASLHPLTANSSSGNERSIPCA